MYLLLGNLQMERRDFTAAVADSTQSTDENQRICCGLATDSVPALGPGWAIKASLPRVVGAYLRITGIPPGRRIIYEQQQRK